MLDINQLVFAEFSFQSMGETLKRWIIAIDESQISDNQDGWSFTRNAWGEIKFVLKKISYSEIVKLGLYNLERGIEFVKTEVCDCFIVFD